jgi:hypothetical protein
VPVGTSTVTAEQIEPASIGALPPNTTLFTARHWNVSQTGYGLGTFQYNIKLDGGTGDFDPGTDDPLILKDNAGVVTSYPAVFSAPNFYTASGLSSFSSFALAAACDPPVISLQPVSRTKCVGDSAHFSATATGTGPGSFIYKWYKVGSGTPLANGGNISGATTNELVINPVSVADAGSYYLTVERPCGGISDPSTTVTLTVNTAPSITATNLGPFNNDNNVCGKSITLDGTNITVNSGTPAPTYTYSLTNFGADLSFPHLFPVGTTTVYVKASNVCGDDIESFTVTVNDVQGPVITCPSDLTLNCDDDNSTESTGSATATDNCDIPANITIDYTEVNGQGVNPALASYYNYTITRTWKATDAAGNSSYCVQTITVQDVTAPVHYLSIATQQ